MNNNDNNNNQQVTFDPNMTLQDYANAVNNGTPINTTGITVPVVTKEPRNIKAIISFILALIPYIIFGPMFIAADGSTLVYMTGFIILYGCTIGIPIYIASFILANSALKKPNHKLAYTATILNALPFIIILLLVILGNLFKIIEGIIR